MNSTAALLLASQSQGEWPVGSGLYTITEYLLFQIIQIWIYEKRNELKMLNLLAEPFYSGMNSVITTIEQKEHNGESNKERKKGKIVESTIHKDDTYQSTEQITNENQHKNDTTFIPTDKIKPNQELTQWKTVQKKKPSCKEIPT